MDTQEQAEKPRSRFYIWLWILLLLFGEQMDRWRADSLAKRVGQLEVEIQQLKK